MGSIANKLKYLLDSVDDIQLAINEKGVDCDDTVELGFYGDKIRSIQSGYKSGIGDFYDIEEFIGLSNIDFEAKNINNPDKDFEIIETLEIKAIPLNFENKVCDVEDVTINYLY